MADEVILGYCVKEKAQKPIKDPEEVILAIENALIPVSLCQLPLRHDRQRIREETHHRGRSYI